MAIQDLPSTYRGEIELEDRFSSARSWEGHAGPALELGDIVKSWRGTGLVLDHVNLAINPGSAVHISGRNGCGKTTLLRIAVGLIAPESGVVTSGGLSPSRNRRRYQQRFGFLAAGDRALYARMTVRQHLQLWSRLSLLSPSEERRAIERALVRFGLEDLAGRRVDRISQGQRQRARLAGSFLHDPPIILLDEPRNSLDDDGIALLIDWLDEVVSRNATVVWCSPNGEATELAFTDRYVLDGGHLRRV